jgi:hypothetical protein
MATKTRTKPEPQTTRLQLWPGGKSVEYQGDPWGPRLLVRYPTESDRAPAFKKATPDEAREVRVEVLAEKYHRDEVWCCDSSLVGDLIGIAYESGSDMAKAFDLSDPENVKNLRADPHDWTVEQCKEWLEDKGHDLPDPNPWTMDRAALVEFTRSEDDNATEDALRVEAIKYIDDEEDDDGLKLWRDAVRDNAEDEEVFEWWRVSEWFARQLDAVGEVVLDNDYGQWWGRTCTGQGMLMDGTLQKVAARHADR